MHRVRRASLSPLSHEARLFSCLLCPNVTPPPPTPPRTQLCTAAACKAAGTRCRAANPWPALWAQPADTHPLPCGVDMTPALPQSYSYLAESHFPPAGFLLQALISPAFACTPRPLYVRAARRVLCLPSPTSICGHPAARARPAPVPPRLPAAPHPPPPAAAGCAPNPLCSQERPYKVVLCTA